MSIVFLPLDLFFEIACINIIKISWNLHFLRRKILSNPS